MIATCRSFKLRIYPCAEQSARLVCWEGALRFLWNLALEQRLMGLSRPNNERKYTTAYAQAREATELRREFAWIADVPRQAITGILDRLHGAWARCFSLKAKTPTFKVKGGKGPSIDIDSREVKWISKSEARLAKLGTCRIVVHRPLPGRTIGLTLVRDVDQWFAVFKQEIRRALPTRISGAIGVDRGVIQIVADSDGHFVKNPRYAARAHHKIARLQRALSRAKKDSGNREKARLRLARAHRKVRRQRAWFQHQVSHDYAKSHGVVVIEKLETARMTRGARGGSAQKRGLNRSILDAGWAGLAEKLRYKLEDRGGELVEVPAAYSSQTCSACGAVDAASRRSQSEFCCTACGHVANADINAARVILSRWSPPVQPVEASL